MSDRIGTLELFVRQLSEPKRMHERLMPQFHRPLLNTSEALLTYMSVDWHGREPRRSHITYLPRYSVRTIIVIYYYCIREC
jgi:hypothetical protein